VICLLDTSGLVRLLRDPKLQQAWYDAIDAEVIGSRYPQRAEFLYSARDAAEYDETTEMSSNLYRMRPSRRPRDGGCPASSTRWSARVTTAAPRRPTSSSPRPPPTTA
jgi:hypothetical protein